MQSSESKSARVLNSCPSLMYRGPKSVSRLHRTEGKDRRVSELLPRPSNWHRNAHSWRQTILTISKARADPSKTASTDLGRPLIGLCQWCATAGFPSATQANSDFFESKLLKKKCRSLVYGRRMASTISPIRGTDHGQGSTDAADGTWHAPIRP